jgi:hypothetical protein
MNTRQRRLGATASATVTVTTPFPNFTSTYTNAVLNLAPVAYWRLNETSGTTAFDSAGGHNGTNHGSLLLGTNGPRTPAFPGFEPINTAYQFNGGADTSVSFPALNLISTNITITAWLKSSGSQATNAGILSWGGTNAFWFGFGSYTNGNLNNALNFERNNFSYTSTLVVPSNQAVRSTPLPISSCPRRSPPTGTIPLTRCNSTTLTPPCWPK